MNDGSGWRPDLFGGSSEDEEFDPPDSKPIYTHEVIITEIQKLEIKEGEVLLVKVPKEMTKKAVQDLARILSQVFGDKTRQVAIVSKDVDFEIADIKRSKEHPLY